VDRRIGSPFPRPTKQGRSRAGIITDGPYSRPGPCAARIVRLASCCVVWSRSVAKSESRHPQQQGIVHPASSSTPWPRQCPPPPSRSRAAPPRPHAVRRPLLSANGIAPSGPSPPPPPSVLRLRGSSTTVSWYPAASSPAL
jgi:hypothetical protein